MKVKMEIVLDNSPMTFAPRFAYPNSNFWVGLFKETNKNKRHLCSVILDKGKNYTNYKYPKYFNERMKKYETN